MDNKFIRYDCSTPIRTVDKDAWNNTEIIRYIDISSLLQLVTSSSLCFTRIDKFEDAYEGNALFGTKKSKKFRDWLTWCFVNCWSYYVGIESYPMWKVHAGPNKFGVAIICNVKSVIDSIVSKKDKKHIDPYIVNYLPPDCKKDLGNAVVNAITKKEFYSYEKEIRFMYYEGVWNNSPSGLNINVKLLEMIDKVIFSPYNPKWANESIENLFTKYKLPNIKFEKSDIKLR